MQIRNKIQNLIEHCSVEAVSFFTEIPEERVERLVSGELAIGELSLNEADALIAYWRHDFTMEAAYEDNATLDGALSHYLMRLPRMYYLKTGLDEDRAIHSALLSLYLETKNNNELHAYLANKIGQTI